MATIGNVGKSGAPPEVREMKLDELVTKKVTCPFLGSAVATEKLLVHVHDGNPLASIQDVIELGNTGGGDLGKVLKFFAKGNHGKMPGPNGKRLGSTARKLDSDVPSGLFSLDLPGSQGSHAGHSGILQGDPTQLDSGRFSKDDFQRLEVKSHDGFLKRSGIARFIAENVAGDQNSKFFPGEELVSELGDILKAATQRGRPNRDQDSVDMEIVQSLTKIAGSNNLFGSAGEFGLLLAFLHHSPNTQLDDEDPAFSMAEITMMFREKDKKLPDGWEEWKKTALNWVLHTSALAGRAVAEFIKIKIGL